MKAIKEQIDEQPKIIKLFSINYARDLIFKNKENYIHINIKRINFIIYRHIAQ